MDKVVKIISVKAIHQSREYLLKLLVALLCRPVQHDLSIPYGESTVKSGEEGTTRTLSVQGTPKPKTIQMRRGRVAQRFKVKFGVGIL